MTLHTQIKTLTDNLTTSIFQALSHLTLGDLAALQQGEAQPQRSGRPRPRRQKRRSMRTQTPQAQAVTAPAAPPRRRGRQPALPLQHSKEAVLREVNKKGRTFFQLFVQGVPKPVQTRSRKRDLFTFAKKHGLSVKDA